MTTLTCPTLPMLLEEVEVTAVERLSPSFVRVELGSPALAELGVHGPLYDQRIKLIFPPAGGRLESFDDADEAWMQSWFARPAEERGHMRTYTVRALRGSGIETRLVVDFVLHGVDGHGEAGPGATWAARARLGHRVAVLAPRRGHPFGGIEFIPGAASRIALAADETAVPAACAVLEQLPDDARGAAFLEVPHPGDVLPVVHPEGFTVTWLPRARRPHGERLHAAVVEDLGAPQVLAATPDVPEEQVDPDLWETPRYSSSGEAVRADAVPNAERYFWIAGESRFVTGLRRVLVKDLGIDRSQVAFMGYWRQGVAMRS